MDQEKTNQTYLTILISSLTRKKEVLEKILVLTKQQEVILTQRTPSMDQLNECMKNKEPLIQEIISLDQGFDSVYQRTKEELKNNKDKYKSEIGKLQELISKVTDLGIKIQTVEGSNKRRIEMFFSSKKQEIKQFQQSNQTVTNYYKNMTGHSQGESYFIDKKK